MNYTNIIKDSVETSLSLNLFKTREQSLQNPNIDLQSCGKF